MRREEGADREGGDRNIHGNKNPLFAGGLGGRCQEEVEECEKEGPREGGHHQRAWLASPYFPRIAGEHLPGTRHRAGMLVDKNELSSSRVLGAGSRMPARQSD